MGVLFAGFNKTDFDPPDLCPDVFTRFRRDAARPESPRIAPATLAEKSDGQQTPRGLHF